MAEIKKNQLANIVFPMVDKTDFATLETGITASNFNSAGTKKFYGVNHGNSTAFTSGAISKATLLVRSGIFQQTLKTTETNYDFIMYRFTHPSCAEQLLVFQCVDYDDSDLFSQLSDIGSDLRSYLVGMSGMLSDVYSNVSDLFSDFQSRVPKRVATDSQLSDLVSDLRSYLVGISGALSDVESQVDLIPVAVSASDMSDIASRVWAAKYTAHSVASSFGSLISDVYSRLVLTQSNVSDVQSALDSQFAYLSNAISDTHSDLRSQISGITASVSASDISDIASAVWAAKYTTHSAASSFGSLFSDVYSRLVLTQSNVSDIESQLDVTHSLLSDVESQVDLLATSNYLSQVHSDLRSQISGITVTVTASDMSDIASRVWATAEGTRVDSRILVIQSLVSDVDSQLLLNASVISDVYSLLSDHHSDFQSRVAGTLATSNQLSQVHSDLRSQISGITASVSASDISDIASAVWGASYSTLGVGASSFGSLIWTTGIRLTNSDISDLRSAIAAGPAATVTASDISDIASAVWAAKYTAHSAASSFGSLFSDVYSRLVLTQSNVSDIESQLDVTHSLLSDVESQVDLLATSNYLSQVHSDLRSQIGGIAVTVTASDMSDIASRVWATAEGARVDSRILVIQSLVSDVDSQLLLNASVISDVYSLLSDHHSDFQSRVTKAVATNSQLSDLASDLRSYLVGISGAISDVESQLDVTQSLVSDIESQLDVTQSLVSDIDSQLTATDATISDISSRIPTSLVGGRMVADTVAISGSTAAADNLEASAEVIVTGSAQTGTLSTTQMTTDLTEATNDHYIGRIIIWTSGVLLGQATNITDYVGTGGLLTFTAVTEAPSNGDTFVIV